jgi:hypothetical protein
VSVALTGRTQLFAVAATQVFAGTTQLLVAAWQSLLLCMLHGVNGSSHGLGGPVQGLVHMRQVWPVGQLALVRQLAPVPEHRPLVLPGHSVVARQVSSVFEHLELLGQSVWVEQPEGGVPPLAQLPPLPACGQSRLVVQTRLLSWVHNPTAGHLLLPRSVQMAPPYWHFPTVAQGAAALQATPVTLHLPV